jgi:hypothetical protein
VAGLPIVCWSLDYVRSYCIVIDRAEGLQHKREEVSALLPHIDSFD